MKSLNFKHKILILVIVPLILVSAVLTALAIFQAKALGKKNVESFSEKIYDLRRGELENYTSLAKTAIKHIYENAAANDEQAQEQAKKILRQMSYGSDGYIFAYEMDGTSIVLRPKLHLEGKNLWDIADANGVKLIQELIADAKFEGGGYTDYIWDKPSKGRAVDKISHSRGIEKWQWMLGTGLYVDDLEDAVANVKLEVDDKISQTLTIVIIFAVGFTLLIALVGARFTISEGSLADAKLQQLSVKNVEVQEAERSRVSRQLQSGISQSLTSVKTKLKNVSTFESLSDPKAREDFVAAVNMLNSTIKEVYQISGELRPMVLDKMGLYPALDALAEKINSEGDLKIAFKHAGSEDRLVSETETALYRIVQEAVKNTQAHANATTLNVRLRQSKGQISLMIQDNGSGFDARTMVGKGNKAGVGLIDMRVRAESLGGTFSVFSSEGTGTMIKVEIPA